MLKLHVQFFLKLHKFPDDFFYRDIMAVNCHPQKIKFEKLILGNALVVCKPPHTIFKVLTDHFYS